jgi:hypothetical protein
MVDEPDKNAIAGVSIYPPPLKCEANEPKPPRETLVELWPPLDELELEWPSPEKYCRCDELDDELDEEDERQPLPPLPPLLLLLDEPPRLQCWLNSLTWPSGCTTPGRQSLSLGIIA